MPEKKRGKYGNDERKYWQKKLVLPTNMNINVVHRYSYLRGKFLSLIYDALGVKLKGRIQVCHGCTKSKAKPCTVRKKKYTRASKPGERIFVDTTGPFPESSIGTRYWIDVIDYYSRYSWSFFTKTRSQLTNKM